MNVINRPRPQAPQRTLPGPQQVPTDASKTPGYEADSIAQFAAMQAIYARHGGVLPADELVQRMRSHRDQPLSILARWIVSRTLISLDWRSVILVPMFQIDPCSGDLRPGCREIVKELRDVMGNWEMACWFARSDPWLGGCAPVDVLMASWREVFQAARAARFVARG